MEVTRRETAISRRTYRGIVYGAVGIGTVGLFVGMAGDSYLAGTVVYLLGTWVGAGVAFLAPRVTDRQLLDERDYDHHNRASGLAMTTAMVLGLGVVPALYVLDAGGSVAITDSMWGGIWVASGLFLLYGLCYGIARLRT